jgi:hypothetical protein
MTKINTWLVTYCGVEEDKANLIETQIIEKFWITSVESLQEMLGVMPEMLDALKLPEPTARLLRMKVGSFNCVRLEALNTREIQRVLSGIFPDGEYADIFITKKINGFVLSTVNSAEKLVQWGIGEEDQAQLLWQKLAQWKVYGVPLEYLETKSCDKRERDETQVQGSSSSTVVPGDSITGDGPEGPEMTSATAVAPIPPSQASNAPRSLQIPHAAAESVASSPVAKKARKSVCRELAALLCDQAAAQRRARAMGLRGSKSSAPGGAAVRGRRGSNRELSSLIADNANPRFSTETVSVSTRALGSPTPLRTTSASNSTQALLELARSEHDGDRHAPKRAKAPAASNPRARSDLAHVASSSPRAREEKKDPLVAMLDSANNATKIRALREYSRLAAKGE